MFLLWCEKFRRMFENESINFQFGCTEKVNKMKNCIRCALKNSVECLEMRAHFSDLAARKKRKKMAMLSQSDKQYSVECSIMRASPFFPAQKKGQNAFSDLH